MGRNSIKIILVLLVLVFVIVASRHYNYHGYNMSVINGLNQEAGSYMVNLVYLLFLLLSLAPLLIELGLIVFLVKNRREIVNLMKDLWNNKGRKLQHKRQNLLVQIIAWLLALTFLALTNINKRALNIINSENMNSSVSQVSQNSTLNIVPSHIQQSISTVFTILNSSSLIAFIILISTFLVIVVWTFRNKENDNDMEYINSEKQFESVVMSTISELKVSSQVNNDPKNIIIKCYNDMCRIISKAGRKPRTYETAREFEKACLSTFPWIPARSLHELTLLFEEVLYSNHSIDQNKVNIAINSLEEINRAMVVRNVNN